jgi:hypothetical protein
MKNEVTIITASDEIFDL